MHPVVLQKKGGKLLLLLLLLVSKAAAAMPPPARRAQPMASMGKVSPQPLAPAARSERADRQP